MFRELQTRFGGSFRGHYSELSSDKAVHFLQVLQPHLILKKLEADIAIRWHSSRPKVQRDAKGRIQSHPPEQQASTPKSRR